MRIGFIGSGSITRAVVTGLCHGDAKHDIWLSPRNAEVAAQLAQLDDRVRVGESNQQVVDASDVVCVAVVPDVADEVLQALNFRADQIVISFVAGVTIRRLKRCIGERVSIVRAIPLPATAHGSGSTVIYPRNAQATELFDAIGATVEVTEESQFDLFSVATATMSTYYSFVEAQAKWLAQRGVPYDGARTFLAGYYSGLAKLAQVSDDSFTELARQCTTEGGINELMHDKLQSEGFFDQVGRAMDAVEKRLKNGL
ncbi:pyrroline-5-carboxylate reductase [Caballeronia concitans]|uniref:Pyrroline-5-carboxylate reductase n=1 Tax=Caballeronia concitans TaxID=1777133 RepID=A0A658R575_9BURK|nr:pyrroline-5-carboxylate reductase [Caballeronia concitans]KIG01631.1 NADP oxidoreductase coenzyme F420-dependent [Burkholderia sp. MR1]SAL52046.1 pyrroline-5-carboxylate reductase [Caballeronia concitans]